MLFCIEHGLAKFRRVRKCVRRAKALHAEAILACQPNELLEPNGVIKLSALEKLAAHFNLCLGLWISDLKGRNQTRIFISSHMSNMEHTEVHIYLWRSFHYALIANLNAFASINHCTACNAFFTNQSNLAKHLRRNRCTANDLDQVDAHGEYLGYKRTFKSGVFKPYKFITDELEEIGVVLPDICNQLFNPFILIFDIESLLQHIALANPKMKVKARPRGICDLFPSIDQFLSVSVRMCQVSNCANLSIFLSLLPNSSRMLSSS